METNLNVPVTTVQHLGTTKFKYTITADNQVRIKIPDRFIGTVYEQDWIDVCNEMTDALALIPRTATLRGRPEGSKNLPSVPLRKKGTSGTAKTNPIEYKYLIFDKKLVKAENKRSNILEDIRSRRESSPETFSISYKIKEEL